MALLERSYAAFFVRGSVWGCALFVIKIEGKTTVKRLLLFVFFVLFVFNLSGCNSTEYMYSIASSDVYLEGEYMRGPTPRAIDIELTLNSRPLKNGTDVNLDYYGTHYHGTVKNDQVIWDRTPQIVTDGTVTKSTIESYNSGIKMIHYFSMNGYIVTGTIVQVYVPK